MGAPAIVADAGAAATPGLPTFARLRMYWTADDDWYFQPEAGDGALDLVPPLRRALRRVWLSVAVDWRVDAAVVPGSGSPVPSHKHLFSAPLGPDGVARADLDVVRRAPDGTPLLPTADDDLLLVGLAPVR